MEYMNQPHYMPLFAFGRRIIYILFTKTVDEKIMGQISLPWLQTLFPPKRKLFVMLEVDIRSLVELFWTYVRELRNTIKRLVLLAADTDITLADLVGNEKQKLISGGVGYEDLYARPYNVAKAEILKRFSRNCISHLLTSHSSWL